MAARSMPPCHTAFSPASSRVCRTRLNNHTSQGHLKLSQDSRHTEVCLDHRKVRLLAIYNEHNPAPSRHRLHHQDKQVRHLCNTHPPSAHHRPARPLNPHRHHQIKPPSTANLPSAKQSSNSPLTLRNPPASSTTNHSNNSSNSHPHPPRHPPTTPTLPSPPLVFRLNSKPPKSPATAASPTIPHNKRNPARTTPKERMPETCTISCTDQRNRRARRSSPRSRRCLMCHRSLGRSGRTVLAASTRLMRGWIKLRRGWGGF